MTDPDTLSHQEILERFRRLFGRDDARRTMRVLSFRVTGRNYQSRQDPGVGAGLFEGTAFNRPTGAHNVF